MIGKLMSMYLVDILATCCKICLSLTYETNRIHGYRLTPCLGSFVKDLYDVGKYGKGQHQLGTYSSS